MVGRRFAGPQEPGRADHGCVELALGRRPPWTVACACCLGRAVGYVRRRGEWRVPRRAPCRANGPYAWMELTCTSLCTPPAMQAAITLRVPPRFTARAVPSGSRSDTYRGRGMDHRVDTPQRRRHRVGIADLGRVMLGRDAHLIRRRVVATRLGYGPHPVAALQQLPAHVAAQEATGPGHRHPWRRRARMTARGAVAAGLTVAWNRTRTWLD